MVLAQAGAAPFDKLRLCDKAANRLRHSVSDAIGQRRDLPLEPHLQTGPRVLGAALFAPTALQRAREQAALPQAPWTSAI